MFKTTGSLPKIFGNTDGLYVGNLWYYFYIVNKAPNADNPYHNTRHSLHVTWLGYLACEHYVKKGQMTKRMVRNQLIAQLMHDHGHPGNNQVPDAENVDLAVQWVTDLLAPEDIMELWRIAPIIRSSEYPHKSKGSDIPLEQRIMHDCDLAQALHPAWYSMICGGLAKEQGISSIEMLERQPSFLENLQFETQWARNFFPEEAIAAKIKEAETLLNGLKSLAE